MKSNKNKLYAKITWLSDDPNASVQALATLIVCNSICINGISVQKNPDGLYITMPKRLSSNVNGITGLTEIVHARTPEMRKAIELAVLGAYSHAKSAAALGNNA